MNTIRKLRLDLLLVACLALIPLVPAADGQQLGDPCFHDIDTGSAPGSTLAPGSSDPDWTIVSGPITGPAIVYEAVPGSYTDAPPAQWLAPSTAYYYPAGDYVFRHTFFVPAGSSPGLDLEIAVDNNVVVLLNGNVVGSVTGSSTTNFQTLTHMATQVGFLVGQTNSLDLRVNNAHANSPMGVVMRGDVLFCAPACNEDAKVVAADAYDVRLSSILLGLTVNPVSAALGGSSSNTVLQQSFSHPSPPIDIDANVLTSSADVTPSASSAAANIADLRVVIGTVPPVVIEADMLRAEARADINGADAGDTRLARLRIDSQVIDVVPAPNTMIALTPDVYVVLNEQIIDPVAPGIEVNLIHVYIGLPGNPLAEIIISHAAAACGPVEGPCPEPQYLSALVPGALPVEPCGPCVDGGALDCVPRCSVARPETCVCPDVGVPCPVCPIDGDVKTCVGDPCKAIQPVGTCDATCDLGVFDCVPDPCREISEFFACDVAACNVVACEAYCRRVMAEVDRQAVSFCKRL